MKPFERILLAAAAIAGPGSASAFTLAPQARSGVTVRAHVAACSSFTSRVSSYFPVAPPTSKGNDFSLARSRAGGHASASSCLGGAASTMTLAGSSRSRSSSDSSNSYRRNGDTNQSASTGISAAEAGASVAGHRRKVLTSVVAGLACYVCSSAVASAVASASGGVAIPTSPSRRAPPIGPTLFLLYLFSVKKVKKRNRFEGVIPKDDDSRKLLADDAYDLAISWGKPAGRIAFVAVDLFIFLFFFRFSGFNFIKFLQGRGMAQLQSAEFWIPYGFLFGLVGASVNATLRVFGQGYVRSTMASSIAPAIQRVLIKPAKAVVSVVGAGDSWDLGLTAEERKNRRPSRELRESLSTFKEDDSTDNEGDDQGSPPPSNPSPGDGFPNGGNGGPMPGYPRTS